MPAVKAIELVAAAVERLRQSYVFPERVPDIESVLAERLASGAYVGLDGSDLCAAVSEDVRTAGRDRHLRVYWTDGTDPVVDWSDPEVLAEYWRQAALDNHGVYRVERLAGNVGYLDLRSVDEAEGTAATLAAAMALLANTSALLLDLRRNSGGAPTGVAFLCSYFFEPEPVHLNDIRSREGVQQFWTLPYLPGPRYGRPVWVLVGADTFSGAEEVAYNLQQRKRATIVGSTTRGGANPADGFALGEHVRIRVPVAYAMNPISGTNWDGVGVVPDVAAEDAYAVAYRAALHAVLADLGDDPPTHARALRTEAEEALAVER